MRRAWIYWQERVGQPSWNMQYAFRGHMLILVDQNTASDGGLARAPSMGVYGEDRDWLVEQIGVIPDIVVDNLPYATFNGADAQLDTAIDYLLQKIESQPLPVPDPPAYPNLRFDYRRISGQEGRGRPVGSRR